jgi:3'(2'), 5'-bisphosphate nucleotidase
MQHYQQHLEAVITIAKQAGAEIMQVYATDFDVENKSDNSPLTKADMAAHQVIVKALKQLTPEIPVLSEESEHISAEERNSWPLYWLIDPLDGTREFVKRNGEFTVNIALIQENVSVLGVVYAPVTELLYYAVAGQGAFKQIKHHAPYQIHTKSLNIERVVVAGSRSHSDHKLQQFLTNMHIKTGATPELIHMGSSLKICLVADGAVDVYPRIGPTSEWDTAAAHCVLTEAGGDIVDISGRSLRYNTKQSLLNPNFFATVKTTFNWSEFL